jgi:hypothetical protein
MADITVTICEGQEQFSVSYYFVCKLLQILFIDEKNYNDICNDIASLRSF